MKQHYRITIQDAITHYNQGDLTAKGLVHFYLKIKIKPGWTIHRSAKEICDELGIKKSAFYNAMSRLKAEGAIDWSVPDTTAFSISLPFRECGNDSTDTETDSADAENDSTNAETNSASAETNSTDAETPSTSAEKKSSKPAPNNDSGDSPSFSQISSQLFSQISSQISLSETEEREKNFNFFDSLSRKEQLALQQTAAQWYLPRLPQYPALPNKWIRRNAIEIYNSDFYLVELNKFSGNSTEEEF